MVWPSPPKTKLLLQNSQEEFSFIHYILFPFTHSFTWTISSFYFLHFQQWFHDHQCTFWLWRILSWSCQREGGRLHPDGGHSMGDAIHSMRNTLKAYSASAPLKDESKMINSCFWLVFPVVTSTTAILLNIFVQNRGFKPRNLLGKIANERNRRGENLLYLELFG